MNYTTSKLCPVCESESVIDTGEEWTDPRCGTLTRVMECADCGGFWHMKKDSENRTAL